jgi:hypothetical protein
MKILIALTVIWGTLLASPAFAQNHADVVAQVATEHPPAKTVDGAFQFTLEVLAALTAQFPQEHAGLLEKVLGDNIVPYAGTLVSAGRIAYPNQHSIKLLSDVPTTNGPKWEDEGPVSLGGFMKGYLAIQTPTPTPTTPAPIVVNVPAAPAPIFDTSALQASIAQLQATVDNLVAADDDAHKSINQNVTDGRAENRSFFAAVGAHWKSISAIAAPFVTYWTCHSTGKC